MCIRRVVGFASILIAIMVGVGSNLGNIIDIPSILIVFGCTNGALLFSGRSIIDAFIPLFSRKSLRSGDGEALSRASETWTEAESYFVGSGFVGFLIGCVIILVNIDNPAHIGPGMAIAILTVLYGIFFKYLICKPIAVYLEMKSYEAYSSAVGRRSADNDIPDRPVALPDTQEETTE